MRRVGVLLFVLVLGPVASAGAADEEEFNLEFFYPLVTRRPVIERELEFKVAHTKGREGRETEATAALEFPILPRWQIELEIPLAFRDPHEGPAEGGIGDLALENKFLLFKSLEHRALVAVGFETRFPTGSDRRGLGGEAAIEPFAAAGIVLGGFDLLAEVAYEFNLNAHVRGEREQQLTAGLAAGYPLGRHFTPSLEVTTVTRARGTDDEDGPRLRGRTQIYLTPGFNVRPLPRTTLRFGIQLPVTDAKQFDYALRAGAVWEF